MKNFRYKYKTLICIFLKIYGTHFLDVYFFFLLILVLAVSKGFVISLIPVPLWSNVFLMLSLSSSVRKLSIQFWTVYLGTYLSYPFIF